MSNNSSSNTSRPLRSYEAVWKQLRNSSNHTVVLEVLDEGFVPRIRRMISKEKDMDVGFKMLNDMHFGATRLKFAWAPEKKELTVQIVSKCGLVEVVS